MAHTVKPTESGWGVFDGDQLVSEHRTRAEARTAKAAPSVTFEPIPEDAGTPGSTTPEPTVAELATAVGTALASPDVRAKLEAKAAANRERNTPTTETAHRDFTGTLAPAMVPFAEAVLEGHPVEVSSSTLPTHGRRLAVTGRPEDVTEAFNLLAARELEAYQAMKVWAQENRSTLRPLSQSRRRSANQAFMVRFARGLAG